MLRFNEDYFTLETEETFSQELYYWEDVLRVAYYVHTEWGYDNRRQEQTYLIVQHECGEYLKIPRHSADWELFDANIGKYLAVSVTDHRRLLENPPHDSLIDLYVREKR